MNAHKQLISLFIGITIVAFVNGCAQGPVLSSKDEFNPVKTTTQEPLFVASQTPSIVQQETTTATPDLTHLKLSITSVLPPLPTLDPSETAKQISTLWKNNGNCKLPCWWGNAPGTTAWEAVYNSLMPLTNQDELLKENVYIFNIKSKDTFSAGFSFNVENKRMDQTYHIRNNIIEYIEIRGYFEGYGLADLLLSYGKPEEIMIGTYQYGENNEPPFDVLIFYPSKGVLAYIAGPNGQIIGNNVNYCFKDEKVYALDLWNPANNYSLQQISEIGDIFTLSLDNEEFQRIQDTTSLSVDSFVTLINENETVCINTPLLFWKNPFD